MCVTQYDCIYQPPSRSSMGLFQIIELIVMGVCGILCAGNLIEYFNKNSNRGVTAVLILLIIGNICVVAGLILVFMGLFCPCQPSNLRTGIICFVVGAIIFAVAILLPLFKGEKVVITQIFQLILLVLLAYVLWIQAGRV